MIRVTCAIVIALSLASPAVYAEESTNPPPSPASVSIRASIEKVKFDGPDRAQVRVRAQTTHHYGVATKVSAGVAMGILGMLGGAMVGVPLMYACGCSAPAYVGVYSGAAAGAISGVWLASR